MNLPVDSATASSFVIETISTIARLLSDLVAREDGERLLGKELSEVVRELALPRGAVLRGALVSDVLQDPRWIPSDEWGQDIRSMICVPLMSGDELLGGGEQPDRVPERCQKPPETGADRGVIVHDENRGAGH